MVIEKPNIDRERLLAEECRRRQAAAICRELLAQLGEGECLGRAVRDGDTILVPVLRPWREGAGSAAEGSGGRVPVPAF